MPNLPDIPGKDLLEGTTKKARALAVGAGTGALAAGSFVVKKVMSRGEDAEGDSAPTDPGRLAAVPDGGPPETARPARPAAPQPPTSAPKPPQDEEQDRISAPRPQGEKPGPAKPPKAVKPKPAKAAKAKPAKAANPKPAKAAKAKPAKAAKPKPPKAEKPKPAKTEIPKPAKAAKPKPADAGRAAGPATAKSAGAPNDPEHPPATTGTDAPTVPGAEPGDQRGGKDPHHALNNPVVDPDETEYPDPYEKRDDPRDPVDPDGAPFGEEPHPQTGAESTSEPPPSQDPEVGDRARPPRRDNLDD